MLDVNCDSYFILVLRLNETSAGEVLVSQSHSSLDHRLINIYVCVIDHGEGIVN